MMFRLFQLMIGLALILAGLFVITAGEISSLGGGSWLDLAVGQLPDLGALV